MGFSLYGIGEAQCSSNALCAFSLGFSCSTCENKQVVDSQVHLSLVQVVLASSCSSTHHELKIKMEIIDDVGKAFLQLEKVVNTWSR